MDLHGAGPVRRVVTGVAPDGTGVFVTDEQVEFAPVGTTGGGVCSLWRLAPAAPSAAPAAGSGPGAIPESGHARMSFLRVPSAEAEEWHRFSAERFDGPREDGLLGIHSTPTTDFCVVVTGRVGLELDTGVEVTLEPGDVVIQQGAPHRWHNRGAGPATIAAVLIGN
jgi:quercetin dioxygenase-like cupin family protein